METNVSIRRDATVLVSAKAHLFQRNHQSPIESEFDREFVGTPFLVKNRVVFLGSYVDQCWFFMVIDGDLMVMNGDLPSGKLTVSY